jgi:hypothetical protein
MNQNTDGSYSTLIIIGSLTAGMVLLLVFLRRRGRSKQPSVMDQLMDAIDSVQEWGLKKYRDRYAGIYKGYTVTFVPETGERIYNRWYTVSLTVHPGDYGLKGLREFLNSPYTVNPTASAFARISFQLNPIVHPDAAAAIRELLDALIAILQEKGLEPPTD